jgi:hypothetical protein
MHVRRWSFAFVLSTLASAAPAQSPIDAARELSVPLPPSPALAGAPSFLGGPWSDDFNRPNAPTLGPDWTIVGGNLTVDANKAHGFTSSATQWARHNSANGTYDSLRASVDFLPSPAGPSVVYVALIFGEGATSDAILIKTQDNTSDGLYDRVFFYKTVGFGGWHPSYYFDLAVPTPSGRMTCYFTGGGDVATLDIDRDFDNVVDEQFTVPGLLGAGLALGTNTGVAAFGNVEFDNWTADDGSGGPSVVSYCTAGTTTHGCVPALGSSGAPSASATSGFTLAATGVEGQKQGLLFYGISGRVALAWGPSTSFLCVKAPTQRTPVQSSGGTLNACDGALSIDWSAYVAANPGSLGVPFQAGDVFQTQAWFRDPPSPKTTMLSDALEVTLGP